MRILVIISSYKMHKSLASNIMIFNEFIKKTGYIVDYAGISSEDDFINYEDIITFKYKMINTKKQLDKICDFISQNTLDYDWFIKVRPEVKLLEPINFNSLLPNSINGRARVYNGPRNIPYGLTVGGEGAWNMYKDSSYYNYEIDVVVDDQLFIFDKKVIEMGGFSKNYIDSDNDCINERYHTKYYNSKNININIIGINMIFYKSDEFWAKSSHIIHHPHVIELFLLMNTDDNQTLRMLANLVVHRLGLILS